jgi:hypothetical protein
LEERRVPTTTAFVTSLYANLLHRNPQSAELTPWVAAINGGLSPQVAATTFTASPEFQANLVQGDYQNLLGRAPSAAELTSWVGALQAGATEQQLVSSFLASPEFFKRAGGTNAAWLGEVYKSVLGRTISPGEQTAWEAAVKNGLPLQTAVFGIANSPESLARIVTAAYESVLGRAPDPQGLADWTAFLENGGSPKQLLALLASSAEFIDARGGLDIVVVPVVVRVPVVQPVPVFAFNPFFAGGGVFVGCGCTSPGFTGGGFTGGGFTGGGFTGGGFSGGGFGGSGSGS